MLPLVIVYYVCSIFLIAIFAARQLGEIVAHTGNLPTVCEGSALAALALSGPWSELSRPPTGEWNHLAASSSLATQDCHRIEGSFRKVLCKPQF